MYAQFANPAHRAATARDFDAALATLCDAFADDPVWGGWAFPERARAAPLRRALFALWLEEALPLEWVRVTGRCEAVALWYPPGSTGDTDEYRRALQELSGRLGAHAENFRRGSELFAESQPAEPCWYLALLAVRSEQRGRGLGLGLLRGCLDAPALRSLPAYLESTNPCNTPHYRRIGFAERGSFRLPGGPGVTRMWRDGAPRPDC